MTAPEKTRDPDVVDERAPDAPWSVIVWDDPVNLMDYVVFVFQEVLGAPVEKATKLMLQVHNEGKAAVFAGMREHAEFTATRLQGFGLWATVGR